MDIGAWRDTVYGVEKSQTRLNLHAHTHTHAQCAQTPSTIIMCYFYCSKAKVSKDSDTSGLTGAVQGRNTKHCRGQSERKSQTRIFQL